MRAIDNKSLELLKSDSEGLIVMTERELRQPALEDSASIGQLLGESNLDIQTARGP